MPIDHKGKQIMEMQLIQTDWTSWDIAGIKKWLSKVTGVQSSIAEIFKLWIVTSTSIISNFEEGWIFLKIAPGMIILLRLLIISKFVNWFPPAFFPL